MIGSMQDLSGPVVALSKLLKNGMEMRVEKVNASGGINGRNIKLIVEDHGYDPKKATDTFINILENLSSPRDMFGSDAMSFSKTRHLGSNRARLSQIVGGKWTVVIDYISD